MFIGGLPDSALAAKLKRKDITMLDAPVVKSKSAAIARERESMSCVTRKRVKTTSDS